MLISLGVQEENLLIGSESEVMGKVRYALFRREGASSVRPSNKGTIKVKTIEWLQEAARNRGHGILIF